MPTAKIKKRPTAAESEIAHLKAQIAAAPKGKNSWVEEIAGTFANDPIFDEAMALGRKWRKKEPIKTARTKRTLVRGKGASGKGRMCWASASTM